MGDAFKKVQRGQRLEVPAEAYNAFLDAALAYRRRQEFGTDASPFFRQSGIVKIKNLSGQDQERFTILGLTDPMILPNDNENEFKQQITFEGVIPDEDEHKGKFAILLEPIADGKIGRGIVAGVTIVRLTVDPEQLYDFAEVVQGNTHALRNVPAGSARVLWLQLASSSERWAVVRLEDADRQAHVFVLSNAPDDDGFYAGEVQRYDVVTKSWQTLFPCKVLDINQ